MEPRQRDCGRAAAVRGGLTGGLFLVRIAIHHLELPGRTMTRRKILIVDDEPTLARELQAALGSFGYDVAGIASSGLDAIALAADAEPDLVLVDLALLKHDANRRIHEMEERFFNVSIDMLCFLDFNGYFKRLNPAWERTLGFTRKELMSRPFIEFVHPDDRERTLAQNAKVRAGGQALGFENRYLCKDGSYRWFLWNAASGLSERTIYSVARDITARKQAEEDRERLVLELQAALAEVRTLQEILPICSYCKKVRDDENYWHSVDSYISQHTKTRFSHSVCPSCYASIVEPHLEGTDGE